MIERIDDCMQKKEKSGSVGYVPEGSNYVPRISRYRKDHNLEQGAL